MEGQGSGEFSKEPTEKFGRLGEHTEVPEKGAEGLRDGLIGVPGMDLQGPRTGIEGQRREVEGQERGLCDLDRDDPCRGLEGPRRCLEGPGRGLHGLERRLRVRRYI